MQTDEQAIRDFVSKWISASKAGDAQTVLGLMADDVVFLQPGHAPMRGKAAFAAAQSNFHPSSFEVDSQIEEIQVVGDWAYLSTKLSVTVVPKAGAAPIERQGYTLSIMKKVEGKWVLFRDANMLAAVDD